MGTIGRVGSPPSFPRILKLHCPNDWHLHAMSRSSDVRAQEHTDSLGQNRDGHYGTTATIATVMMVDDSNHHLTNTCSLFMFSFSTTAQSDTCPPQRDMSRYCFEMDADLLLSETTTQCTPTRTAPESMLVLLGGGASGLLLGLVLQC